MPLFWIAHSVDGKPAVFVQEASAAVYARLLAAFAGFPAGEFIGVHALDQKTAKAIPKSMIGRALSGREANKLLDRIGS